MLVRDRVPGDHSCLFTSLARLCGGVTDKAALKDAGHELRVVCADLVLADEDPATRALMLGHDSVEAYAAWIQDEHHWGGEPEVLMLAGHFGVEIVVCSCESLIFLRYRAEECLPPRGRVYLLYTGQHYDPLIGADGTLAFESAPAAEVLEEAALAIAREHNEARSKAAVEELSTELIREAKGLRRRTTLVQMYGGYNAERVIVDALPARKRRKG